MPADMLLVSTVITLAFVSVWVHIIATPLFWACIAFLFFCGSAFSTCVGQRVTEVCCPLLYTTVCLPTPLVWFFIFFVDPLCPEKNWRFPSILVCIQVGRLFFFYPSGLKFEPAFLREPRCSGIKLQEYYCRLAVPDGVLHI